MNRERPQLLVRTDRRADAPDGRGGVGGVGHVDAVDLAVIEVRDEERLTVEGRRHATDADAGREREAGLIEPRFLRGAETTAGRVQHRLSEVDGAAAVDSEALHVEPVLGGGAGADAAVCQQDVGHAIDSAEPEVAEARHALERCREDHRVRHTVVRDPPGRADLAELGEFGALGEVTGVSQRCRSSTTAARRASDGRRRVRARCSSGRPHTG